MLTASHLGNGFIGMTMAKKWRREIMKMDNIIILQNKIDLIYEDPEKSMENYK